MKNVTVTLDEEVARWARVRAAELDITVLRMLGDLLQKQMRREVTYPTEVRQYLLRKRRNGRINVPVMQEFYVTVARKLRPGMSPAEA